MWNKLYNTKNDMIIFESAENVSLTDILNKVDANWRLYDMLALQWYDAKQVKEILYDMYKVRKLEKLKKHKEKEKEKKKKNNKFLRK